jgi:hypothetical protein
MLAYEALHWIIRCIACRCTCLLTSPCLLGLWFQLAAAAAAAAAAAGAAVLDAAARQACAGACRGRRGGQLLHTGATDMHSALNICAAVLPRLGCHVE